MSADYLLRFDDICPTMNWRVWEQIESILREADVKPILAVVPDNRDPELMVEASREAFWERVQLWQSFGWTLALHGYQHRYTTRDAGIVGLNRYSEFAGVPRCQQQEMLSSAKQIFRREQIDPKVWIAPAHSFDAATVEVLSGLGISAISDGFAVYPYTDQAGMFWVPQQFWKFRQMPFGVWTICMHHNDWGTERLNAFRGDVAQYRDRIVAFDDVHRKYKNRRKGLVDDLVGGALHLQLSLIQRLRNRNQPEKRLPAMMSSK